MKEYYILVEAGDIFGVFETLEECLTWKPTRKLEKDTLVIKRIKRHDDNTFSTQLIYVNMRCFAEKVESNSPLQ
jgi:hypothetical protein